MNGLVYPLMSLVACALIFARVEPILNRMGPECSLPVRAAFWMLAIGALAQGYVVFEGYPVHGPSVLIQWGVAVFLTAEKRLRALLRIPPPPLCEDRRAAR